jgi:hypothetical protein
MEAEFLLAEDALQAGDELVAKNAAEDLFCKVSADSSWGSLKTA